MSVRLTSFGMISRFTDRFTPARFSISGTAPAIPEEERQAHCTAGLDFVRARNKVVGYKHQHCEEFVGVYVAAREAEGAVTSLHPINEPERTEIAVQLKPGELLIFRDRDFMRDATPLLPRYDGDRPDRDAIVALIHYATYFSNPGQ
ncbi:hypothetical protein [Paraburkholderia humisilvae]|uniref:hypothetical protein n=1 Tax=Paraburkholderia humisilvae TaxID=627669 RepID=UPI00158433C5|nr:hypothetical protein [Paraburkholderia humisilvae]